MNSYVTTPTPNASVVGGYVSSSAPGLANSYVSGVAPARAAGSYVTVPVQLEDIVLAA
ncbi:MAG: hypothetical protein H7248_10490 [Microbacteriaceae bacterium]|nr:hypothetical protein [Microbacteriaceae bacterium]